MITTRMNVRRMSIITLTFGLILFVCPNPNNSGGTAWGVDFSSYNTDYSILIRNNTGERLVAFKGDLKNETLIGGIPARVQIHGLPRNPALFDKTEDFPLILLTEAQYNANKDNLSSQRNTPFTIIYVFYNKSGKNEAVYEIAGCLGGSNTLQIINTSNSINVELRLNGVTGETLGYAPAGILNTTLKLQDGNYNIFPVFKRYNKIRDVVETVYPKGSDSGEAWYQTFSFSGATVGVLNLKTILESTAFTSGVAFVNIINQTSRGIRFLEGNIVRRTESGLENIMSGYSRTFRIDMPVIGGKYANSVVAANWKFGPTGYEVALQTNENDSSPVTSLIIEQDKMYHITVTGSHDNNTLKAYVINVTDIPSD